MHDPRSGPVLSLQFKEHPRRRGSLAQRVGDTPTLFAVIVLFRL